MSEKYKDECIEGGKCSMVLVLFVYMNYMYTNNTSIMEHVQTYIRAHTHFKINFIGISYLYIEVRNYTSQPNTYCGYSKEASQ